MDTLRQDLRQAVRMLSRRPGWTTAAVLTLALGIGATTAIYGIVHGVLLRALPYPESDRLVSAWQVDAVTGEGLDVLTWPWYEAWRERQAVLPVLGAYAAQTVTLHQPDGSEQVAGALVSTEVLEALGVVPAIGRRFVAEDDVEGAAPVVMIGHAAWRRRFGGRPDIIGSILTISERPRTVVGVMPEGFEFPAADTEFWLPMAAAYRDPGTAYLSLLGMLPAGVGRDAVQARLAAATREQPGEGGMTSVRLEIRPLHETLVGDSRTLLLVFFGAVAVLLLVATLNVANLMLVRTAERERELSVRAALGAGRGRLVRQQLTEGVVLATIAAALGVTLAVWLLAAFAALGPSVLPRATELSLDRGVLAFAAALTLLVGLGVGVAPALRAARSDLISRLRAGGTTGPVGSGRRLRSGLVVAQITLATVLLAAGGLLLRSFLELHATDSGFRPERVVTIGALLPASRYGEIPQKRTFYVELIQRLEATPSFTAAAVVSFLPYSPARSIYDLEIEARPAQPGAGASAELLVVSPAYFQVMGVPLRYGRLLADGDGEGGRPVVVVSETLARQHWPGEDPIGRRIRLEDETWRTIVGVVGETRQHGLHAAPTPLVYVPYAQAGTKWPFGMSMIARTTGDLAPAASAARGVIASLDAGVAVSRIRRLDDWRADSVAAPRLRVWIIGSFALVALLLAAIGVYGVMAYAATQRTREVGVRLALGATRSQIVTALIRQGATVTALGLALGLAGALLAGRVLESYLFGVAARDPATLAAISALLASAALTAAWIPARRASRLEPVGALRD